MAKSIQDVMHANPITMPVTSSVMEAARAMRESNIGDVIVLEEGQICGIVTDRDLVIRTLAEGQDPAATELGAICSRDLTTMSPENTVEDAVQLMRDKTIRRLPVVDNNIPVGIVSLGDLAIEQDPHSVLGAISAAQPTT